MNRIHTNIVLALIAAGVLLVAGCKREYGIVTLGADIDNGRDAKVYIDNLTPCWHNNDLIRVNNQTCTTSAALGSTAQIADVVESNHYRAIYPADIVGDVDISSNSTIAVTLPRVQQYEVDSRGDQKVKVPMGAYSSSERLTFHNLCSLIKVVISNQMNYDFHLDSIVVAAGSAYLSGLGSATVAGRASDAVGMMVSSSASHSVSLAFAAAERPIIGRGDRDTYVYYIIAPEFAEDDVTIKLYSQGVCATFEKNSVTLRHNRIAMVSLTVDQWDGHVPAENGSLYGLFSVSATKQVRFSQGNLQYQASTGIWRFAEHQYDYLGSANNNISSINSGWIDLFGWGTSGWNSGAVCYQPWSTSTIYSDYYPGGSYTNGLTGAYAEADWAWHNAINNGGNAVHQWRTLTSAEWNYLLYTRINASSKLGIGNINGVNGLIILPDNWVQPSSCSFTPGFASNFNDWTRNDYTFVHWAQMEDAGAVFLPVACCRSGANITSVDYGNYWTSSPNNEINVYAVYFYSIQLSLTLYNRSVGFSVRPVQDVE